MVGSREFRVVIASAMVLVLLSGVSIAQTPPSPDNTVVVVNRLDATANTGTLGSFTYDAGRNCIWIGVYGSGQGIRKYDLATGTATQMVQQGHMDFLARASDMAGGVVWAGDGGAQRCFGLLLNKSTLTLNLPRPANLGGGTFDLTYPPGTMLFSCDQPDKVMQGGSTFKPAWTKMMYRYDMRRIGDPTDPGDPWQGQLDYATAQDGGGNVIGAYGTIDWNDPFTVVCNAQQFLDASGVLGRVPTVGRQASWSSDGLSLYWNDSAPYFGGIWKVNAQTGAISWIYQSLGGTPSLNSEMAVIHTSVRDLDPTNPTTGDQILFRGTGNASNAYGISYIIHDGTTTTGPFTLLTKADFDKLMEWNIRWYPSGSVNGLGGRLQNLDGSDPGVYEHDDKSPDTWAMVATADGTLYFTDNSTEGGLWRYDLQGRLSGFRSVAQVARWYTSIGLTNVAKQMLHPQLREITYTGPSGSFTIPQLLYRDNGSSPVFPGVGGANIFKACDFNRDNVADQADLDLFDAALAVPVMTFSKYGTETPPLLHYYEAPAVLKDDTWVEMETADDAGSFTYLNQYLDYLKCDMNNNGLVTVKDKQILGRFFGKAVCDYDWDGNVDMDEFGHFQSCYTGTAATPSLQQIACGNADLNGDAKVDSSDLTILRNCMSGPSIPADVNCGL